MNPSFGPWATAVATGANQQLDTFWKKETLHAVVAEKNRGLT